MEIRQILQFSEISGTRRNPGSGEANKLVAWDNSTSKYKYVLAGSGNIDESYFTTFITNIIGSTVVDDYLTGIVHSPTGGASSSTWAYFTMAETATKTLKLGELAWLDDAPTPTLPGDQRILFHEVSGGEDIIGGRYDLKYNYNTNSLLFAGVPMYFSPASGSALYAEGVRYIGTGGWVWGHGDSSNNMSSTYSSISGYKAGHSLTTGATLNTIYGPYAGQTTGGTTVGAVYLGAYAGRYETANNKFFLDNTDYGGVTTARDSSFLYADLDTERRLYIRDRLSVEKEGLFGDSGLSDGNGEMGMFQMLYVSPGVVKPQYYSNNRWNDFASSVDVYLSNVSYTGGALTFTMSDASTIGPIDISAVNTTVFATSPSSPATGQTATSNYGYLQISNSSFTDNEGFTHVGGLYWSASTTELYVPGGLHLTTKAQYTASVGVVIYNGSHFYGRLGTGWAQLDNETASIDNIDGLNIGGALYEIFVVRDSDDYLEFRTMQPMGVDQVSNPNDRITMSYTTDGNAILIGTTAEKNRLDTVVDAAFGDCAIDRDNVGETLLMRALRPGSGVTLTQTENYIQIDAVTLGGGGEVNLMNNNGAGIEFYGAKNGVTFEMYTLSTSDSRIDFYQATDYVTDPENTIDLVLEIKADSTPYVGPFTDHDTVLYQVTNAEDVDPTIWFKTLVSDTLTFTTTVNNELQIEVSGSPTAATGVNNGSGVIEIFDDSSVMPDFEFRTIDSRTGYNTVASPPTQDHLSIEYNGDLIEINVDDLVVTYSGTGEQLFDLDTDGWTILEKGLTGIHGVTVSDETTDIQFTIPNIPDFEISAGDFVTSKSYTGTANTSPDVAKGTISFLVSYDEEHNDGVDDHSDYTVATLQIGPGLEYDSSNNILWASSSSTGDTNYNLLNIVTETPSSEYYIFTFEVQDSIGNDAVGTPLTLNVPRYSLPIADYTDVTGSTGDLGGVKVYHLGHAWEESGTMYHLELDEATGKIYIPQMLVTYDIQNNLHDEDNGEGGSGLAAKRDQARANIGAAYVEGDLDEDFNVKILTADPTDGYIDAQNITDTHQIGSIDITANEIAGETSVILTNETSGINRIEINAATANIYLDENVLGRLNIWKDDGSTQTKLFCLDKNGNLYVAGHIYAGNDIEAFDTTVLPTVGITPV